MGRHSADTSYSHRVMWLCSECYRISWYVDCYYTGSRLRYPTGNWRDTDAAGAARFIKKWDITRRIPEQLQQDLEAALGAAQRDQNTRRVRELKRLIKDVSQRNGLNNA